MTKWLLVINHLLSYNENVIKKGVVMIKIGERILALRKEKHLTQSDLANAIGVTTQAVSKWERGGTPDVESLPLIADYFHISLDYLFQRQNETEEDIAKLVYSLIKKLPEDKRNITCFYMMLSAFNACSGIDELETLYDINSVNLSNDLAFGYQMSTDEVFAVMTLMSRSPYAMFMPEPKEGYLDSLLKPEEYRAFFEFLSKPFCMEVLLKIYQRTNGFTLSLLANELSIKEEDILPILSEMVAKHWLAVMDIDMENKTVAVYTLELSITALPFLLITREFCNQIQVGYTLLKREKPILNSNENKHEIKK